MNDDIELKPLDRIRAAERLIRERATVATSGPWEFRPRRGFESIGHNPATIGFVGTAGYFVMLREGTWATESDMAYIASWHPAVALAVADWLHTAGADLWAHGPLCECGTGCDACDDNLWEPHARAALALADQVIRPGQPAGGDQS